MSHEEPIEVEGTVSTVLPGTMFRVRLDNQHEILAHLSGKMRKHFVRLTVGTGCDWRCRPTICPRRGSRIACADHFSVVSRKPASLLRRAGWRSLRRALASIWRMRSRLTLYCLPTSSNVRG